MVLGDPRARCPPTVWSEPSAGNTVGKEGQMPRRGATLQGHGRGWRGLAYTGKRQGRLPRSRLGLWFALRSLFLTVLKHSHFSSQMAPYHPEERAEAMSARSVTVATYQALPCVCRVVRHTLKPGHAKSQHQDGWWH